MADMVGHWAADLQNPAQNLNRNACFNPYASSQGVLGHCIDEFVQDCSISSALAMEILQSCTKLSISINIWYSMSYSDLSKVIGYQCSSPINGC